MRRIFVALFTGAVLAVAPLTPALAGAESERHRPARGGMRRARGHHRTGWVPHEWLRARRDCLRRERGHTLCRQRKPEGGVTVRRRLLSGDLELLAMTSVSRFSRAPPPTPLISHARRKSDIAHLIV